jgi:pimeloyl-ACP methyl ester carboxylesterase
MIGRKATACRRWAFCALFSLSLAATQTMAAEKADTWCRPAPAGIDVDAATNVRVHVRTIGTGRPILFIPSLARGASDFDDIAQRLAKQGYMAILPDPRGTGATSGPAPASLFDLAHDAKAAVAALCDGPVDVVGHAFGNRVARALAAASPATVRAVVLLAGGGKAKPLPQVGDSIAVSAAQGVLPDDQRLAALKTAFFAPGHDSSIWLTGWYAQAKTYQGLAMQGSTIDQWWSGGSAPILLVQADADPVAPAGNVAELRKDIGVRLRTVTLRQASHAILPEQPEAVTFLLASYFGGERDEPRLQRGADARIRP